MDATGSAAEQLFPGWDADFTRRMINVRALVEHYPKRVESEL